MKTIPEILSELVRIPSVSPDLERGDPAANEMRLGEHLAEQFSALGAEVDFELVAPNRPNVYALFEGREEGATIACDIHTDTVDVRGMTVEPFGGAIRDGRVWGRGAVDTKASFAIVLSLLAGGRRPRSRFVVACTVGEETYGIGAIAHSRWARRRGIVFSELVVAEPTKCCPVRATNGLVRGGLRLLGRGAHTCAPEHGVNAVSAAVNIAAAFSRHHEELLRREATCTGRAQLTVTGMSGGGFSNVVPERCEIFFDRRIVPGEDPDAILAGLRELALRSIDSRIELSIVEDPPLLVTRAVETPEDAPLIRRFVELSGQPAGTEPYGTNAAFYDPDIAKQVVVFGPGSIEQAHKPDEWVEIAELERARGIYERWLGLGGGKSDLGVRW